MKSTGRKPLNAASPRRSSFSNANGYPGFHPGPISLAPSGRSVVVRLTGVVSDFGGIEWVQRCGLPGIVVRASFGFVGGFHAVVEPIGGVFVQELSGDIGPELV
jgi:hypothetical protein